MVYYSWSKNTFKFFPRNLCKMGIFQYQIIAFLERFLKLLVSHLYIFFATREKAITFRPRRWRRHIISFFISSPPLLLRTTNAQQTKHRQDRHSTNRYPNHHTCRQARRARRRGPQRRRSRRYSATQRDRDPVRDVWELAGREMGRNRRRNGEIANRRKEKGGLGMGIGEGRRLLICFQL